MPLTVQLDASAVVPVRHDHRKAERELGLTFTPIATAVVDMATFLVRQGVVPLP